MMRTLPPSFPTASCPWTLSRLIEVLREEVAPTQRQHLCSSVFTTYWQARFLCLLDWKSLYTPFTTYWQARFLCLLEWKSLYTSFFNCWTVNCFPWRLSFWLLRWRQLLLSSYNLESNWFHTWDHGLAQFTSYIYTCKRTTWDERTFNSRSGLWPWQQYGW